MAPGKDDSIQIGTRLPGWLPKGLHLPFKLAIGIVIGLVLAFYCIALAFTVDRIWRGVSAGADTNELAFDIGYLVVLIGAAYLLRHVLKRGRRGPAAEM